MRETPSRRKQRPGSAPSYSKTALTPVVIIMRNAAIVELFIIAAICTTVHLRSIISCAKAGGSWPLELPGRSMQHVMSLRAPEYFRTIALTCTHAQHNLRQVDVCIDTDTECHIYNHLHYYIYIYTCICVYVNIYIYTCTYFNTYTYTHTCTKLCEHML